jgi:hypothetical protein
MDALIVLPLLGQEHGRAILLATTFIHSAVLVSAGCSPQSVYGAAAEERPVDWIGKTNWNSAPRWPSDDAVS